MSEADARLEEVLRGFGTHDGGTPAIKDPASGRIEVGSTAQGVEVP